MTLLAGGASLLIASLFTAFTVELAGAAGSRSRAQAAADAAALAAVAESAPYGADLQEARAREYAQANGAELLECLCESGATAVQVRVHMEGIEAEARAVLDPEALMPARVGYHTGGLHPLLAAAVDRLIRAAAGRIRVVSGYRSPQHQAVLWREALARHGNAEAADDWVAPPGRSMHERGLAVDLGGDLDLAARLVTTLGLPLHRPLPNEPWHFELVGART